MIDEHWEGEAVLACLAKVGRNEEGNEERMRHVYEPTVPIIPPMLIHGRDIYSVNPLDSAKAKHVLIGVFLNGFSLASHAIHLI